MSKKTQRIQKVLIERQLALEVIKELKNTENGAKLALQLQQVFEASVPYGYVWVDEYEGGCFVYPHEHHPKDATMVYA